MSHRQASLPAAVGGRVSAQRQVMGTLVGALTGSRAGLAEGGEGQRKQRGQKQDRRGRGGERGGGKGERRVEEKGGWKGEGGRGRGWGESREGRREGRRWGEGNGGEERERRTRAGEVEVRRCPTPGSAWNLGCGPIPL